MLLIQFCYEAPTISLYLTSVSNRTAITNAVVKVIFNIYFISVL